MVVIYTKETCQEMSAAAAEKPVLCLFLLVLLWGWWLWQESRKLRNSQGSSGVQLTQPSATAREFVMRMKACVVRDVAEDGIRLLLGTPGHHSACGEIRD